MKKAVKITLSTIGIVVAVIIIAIVVFFVWASKQPAVKDNYFDNVKTTAPIEKKYTQKGSYQVSYYEQKANNDKWKKYEVWYPTEMETTDNTYPLVVMVNGTGVPASKYKAIFDHLASWGFIVIGNEDESSGTGESSSASLDYILTLNSDSNSKFYGKIDIDNIGVGGHSQGGLGSINAVTAQDNGNKYKVIYTASAPSSGISEGVLKAPFDISSLSIPYFFTAGTGTFDAGDGGDNGISPLWSMDEKYNAVSDDVPKIMARRVDTDHGDMLPYADGYMTAWFMYWLKGDTSADFFSGDNAEILSNTIWQDVKKNIK